MKLGMQVGLGAGHIVLDGGPAPSPKGAEPPNFGAYLLWPNGWLDLRGLLLRMVWWRNGYSVELAINRSRFQVILGATLHNNLGQVVHTYASVTKQCNLVPVCLCLQPLNGLTTWALAKSAFRKTHKNHYNVAWSFCAHGQNFNIFANFGQ